MNPSDVILSRRAQALCAQLGISQGDLRKARAGPTSGWEGREYYVVTGELPDGRSVRMSCRHDHRHYIVTFRPI